MRKLGGHRRNSVRPKQWRETRFSTPGHEISVDQGVVTKTLVIAVEQHPAGRATRISKSSA
jgi:hypothetical protein